MVGGKLNPESSPKLGLQTLKGKWLFFPPIHDRRAQGREVQGPNIDDEDIEDVTAAAQAAKAGTADVVDLTRDDAVVQPDPVPYWTNVKQERAEKAAAS